jgi:hypothetical protein
MKASTPGFCKPTALSMPPGVSAQRGVGLPTHGMDEMPFVIKPPRLPSG